MAVPDYQSLMRPVLGCAAIVSETSIKLVAPEIAQALKLSEAALAERLPSGRQTVFHNRLHWAKTYLQGAMLVEPTRRGFFQITDRGRILLRSFHGTITNRVLDQFSEFVAWRKGSDSCNLGETLPTPPTSISETATPDEVIERTMTQLDGELRVELLARLLAEAPSFFERFIVELLIAMGYGGGALDRGQVIGKPGDGGIDGVIREDALGLDAIYVQAKRYAIGSTVGRPDLQRFVGSMTGEGATKGVFVTTSAFTAEARDYVRRVGQRIVLIEGEELADLAVRHSVGVRTRQTYALKRIDEDYIASED